MKIYNFLALWRSPSIGKYWHPKGMSPPSLYCVRSHAKKVGENRISVFNVSKHSQKIVIDYLIC